MGRAGAECWFAFGSQEVARRGRFGWLVRCRPVVQSGAHVRERRSIAGHPNPSSRVESRGENELCDRRDNLAAKAGRAAQAALASVLELT